MSRTCAHCGADVSSSASFCRECGSDFSTGWSDDVEAASTELFESMSDDDYEEFLAREFPRTAQPRRVLRRRLSALLVLAALAVFVFWVIVH